MSLTVGTLVVVGRRLEELAVQEVQLQAQMAAQYAALAQAQAQAAKKEQKAKQQAAAAAKAEPSEPPAAHKKEEAVSTSNHKAGGGSHNPPQAAAAAKAAEPAAVAPTAFAVQSAQASSTATAAGRAASARQPSAQAPLASFSSSSSETDASSDSGSSSRSMPKASSSSAAKPAAQLAAQPGRRAQPGSAAQRAQTLPAAAADHLGEAAGARDGLAAQRSAAEAEVASLRSDNAVLRQRVASLQHALQDRESEVLALRAQLSELQPSEIADRVKQGIKSAGSAPDASSSAAASKGGVLPVAPSSVSAAVLQHQMALMNAGKAGANAAAASSTSGAAHRAPNSIDAAPFDSVTAGPNGLHGKATAVAAPVRENGKADGGARRQQPGPGPAGNGTFDASGGAQPPPPPPVGPRPSTAPGAHAPVGRQHPGNSQANAMPPSHSSAAPASPQPKPSATAGEPPLMRSASHSAVLPSTSHGGMGVVVSSGLHMASAAPIAAGRAPPASPVVAKGVAGGPAGAAAARPFIPANAPGSHAQNGVMQHAAAPAVTDTVPSYRNAAAGMPTSPCPQSIGR